MKRWAKDTNEGSEEHLFERNKTKADTEVPGSDTEEYFLIDITIVRSRNSYDDIAMVRALGLMVDNDKEPAPEDIPDRTTNKSSTPKSKWGWNGKFHRKLMRVKNLQLKLNIVSGKHLDILGYVAMFLMFFQRSLLKQSS